MIWKYSWCEVRSMNQAWNLSRKMGHSEKLSLAMLQKRISQNILFSLIAVKFHNILHFSKQVVTLVQIASINTHQYIDSQPKLKNPDG